MEYFCIKFKNMYLSYLSVDTDYPENNFITSARFDANKAGSEKFEERTAYKIIEKLDEIGFDKEKMLLEKVKVDD